MIGALWMTKPLSISKATFSIPGTHRPLVKDETPHPKNVLGFGEQTVTFNRSLDAAAVLPEYLGPEFCRLYVTCRRAERRKFRSVVTELEYQWYLRTV